MLRVSGRLGICIRSSGRIHFVFLGRAHFEIRVEQKIGFG